MKPTPAQIRSVGDVIHAVTRSGARIHVLLPERPLKPDRLHPPLVRPDFHNYFEVAICFEGEMSVVGFSATIRLHAGDVVEIEPGAWHYESYRSANRPYESFWLVIAADRVNAISTRYRKGSVDIHQCDAVPSVGANPLVETLARELTVQPLHWRDRSRSLLTEMLIDYDRRSQGAPPSRPPELDPVQKLARILETRFREPLQVKSLSKEVGLSADHLSRRFHTASGVTFKEYLNTIRIHHAQLLLRSGWTIKRTADECGFSDVFYFARVFKQRCKTSPGKFRRGTKG